MAHTTDYINTSIGNIEVLHARFANELCNMLKRRTGRHVSYNELLSLNNLTGRVIEILTDYNAYGDSTLNDLSNGLTETEVQSLINMCYRKLNKYTYNIFLPDNPNVYL